MKIIRVSMAMKTEKDLPKGYGFMGLKSSPIPQYGIMSLYQFTLGDLRFKGSLSVPTIGIWAVIV